MDLGFSSWIRGQLVLQWERENNRERKQRERGSKIGTNHLIDISVQPFPLYP